MENKTEILKTPNIIKKEFIKFKTNDKILDEIINNFTYVLERDIPKENLILFYNNLSTLKVDNRIVLDNIKSTIFNKNVVVGYYLIDENIISIMPIGKSKILNVCTEEYIVIVCHELLHMSSSIVDKEKRISFSGFSQITSNNVLGLALDDAYTEIIAYRYFNLNHEFMSYDYEIIITTLIEDIIGKDKMTTFYFNANLYDFICELENYNSRANIIKFLNDLDSIYALRDQNGNYKKYITYYHNEISNFIVKTCQNKLNQDLKNKIITLDEHNKNLDNCLNNLHIAFKKLNISKKRNRRNTKN